MSIEGLVKQSCVETCGIAINVVARYRHRTLCTAGVTHFDRDFRGWGLDNASDIVDGGSWIVLFTGTCSGRLNSRGVGGDGRLWMKRGSMRVVLQPFHTDRWRFSMLGYALSFMSVGKPTL